MSNPRKRGGFTRQVAQLIDRQRAMEGAGVSIHRVMPLPELPHLDPFLLLDEIRSDQAGDYIAGFPPHPHRGVETITYMLHGRMHHRDSGGGDEVIGPGDVQWMTAGRGIIHSEMPEQLSGLMWGFQLWLNLPAREKMATPSSYRELHAKDIPEVRDQGSRVRVIAGSQAGRVGPAPERTTRPLLLDVELDAGGGVMIEIPTNHAGFVYVFDGEMGVGERAVALGQTAVLGDGRGLELSSREGGRALLAAGLPLGEPIVRGGPFVMSTEQDLRQAYLDLQTERFLGAH